MPKPEHASEKGARRGGFAERCNHTSQGFTLHAGGAERCAGGEPAEKMRRNQPLPDLSKRAATVSRKFTVRLRYARTLKIKSTRSPMISHEMMTALSLLSQRGRGPGLISSRMAMLVQRIANSSHGSTSTRAMAAPEARLAFVLLRPVHMAT